MMTRALWFGAAVALAHFIVDHNVSLAVDIEAKNKCCVMNALKHIPVGDPVHYKQPKLRIIYSVDLGLAYRPVAGFKQSLDAPGWNDHVRFSLQYLLFQKLADDIVFIDANSENSVARSSAEYPSRSVSAVIEADAKCGGCVSIPLQWHLTHERHPRPLFKSHVTNYGIGLVDLFLHYVILYPHSLPLAYAAPPLNAGKDGKRDCKQCDDIVCIFPQSSHISGIRDCNYYGEDKAVGDAPVKPRRGLIVGLYAAAGSALAYLCYKELQRSNGTEPGAYGLALLWFFLAVILWTCVFFIAGGRSQVF